MSEEIMIEKSLFSVGHKRKRLLQVFSRYKQYGGEEGSVYRIGDALASEYDVGTFLASSKDAFSGGSFSKGLAALKSFSNWPLIRQLRHCQEIGEYDYWLVHNVFPVMSPSVYSLAFVLGVPIIQYLHNYRMGCVNGFFMNHGKPCQRCMHGNFFPALQTACWHESHLQSGVMGAIMMRAHGMKIFEKIHHWIAISEAQKKEHVAMGIPEERISVIHHFFEVTGKSPPYPEQGDVILVGRLSQEKGIDRLLLAWEKIHDCGRILWIVGDGPERNNLEAMVSARSLRNVRFTGFLNHAEMKEIWEKAACSVVPSVWKEPFGMVVLESWDKGRPVVAHRIGALPEIIDDGQNGTLVNLDSPQEMADAILAILENPQQGEMMGKNGIAKLEHDFSRDKWLKKIIGVIESDHTSYAGESNDEKDG